MGASSPIPSRRLRGPDQHAQPLRQTQHARERFCAHACPHLTAWESRDIDASSQRAISLFLFSFFLVVVSTP